MAIEDNEYDCWNKQKQKLSKVKRGPFFKEGEIRWVRLGVNIKTEIAGKGTCFYRPVYILKKLFGHSCFVLPLSSQPKEGYYYCNVVDSKNKTQCVILAQGCYIDGARIEKKLSALPFSEKVRVKEAYIDFIKNIP